MCWVLDGGLRCVCVQCACAFARELMCVFVSSSARAVRACVTACLCERMCVFVRFHRIAIPRVCVASARVCVASACVRRGAVRALPSRGGGLRY